MRVCLLSTVHSQELLYRWPQAQTRLQPQDITVQKM